MTDQIPTRVVLMGNGTLTIRAAEWLLGRPEFELAAVVPSMPEPTWTDSLIGWATDRDVPYVASGLVGDLDDVLGGDRIPLAISIFYNRIIKAGFIDRCDRIVNLHNGPLPRYRGVSPINWALKNGEREHGVTLHEITPGIDDGPIIAQLRYSIYPEFDEVRDVYARALQYGWTLFEQTLPLLARIAPVPQDEREALYYSSADNDRLGDRRSWTRAISVGK